MVQVKKITITTRMNAAQYNLVSLFLLKVKVLKAMPQKSQSQQSQKVHKSHQKYTRLRPRSTILKELTCLETCM